MDQVKYAHLFRFAAGSKTENYLYAKHLGSGSEGTAQAVYRPEDNDLFVRKVIHRDEKLEVPNQEIVVNQAIKDSVSLNRPPRSQRPLIPILINHREFVNQDAFPLATKDVEIITEFCNGGDFCRFLKHFDTAVQPLRTFSEAQAVPLPKVPVAVIWKMLSQILQTVDYNFHMKPMAVIHNDLAIQNIFLNWHEGAEMPDFFLGDFGFATFHDDNANEEERTEVLLRTRFEWHEDYANDLHAVVTLAKYAMGYSAENCKTGGPIFRKEDSPYPIILYMVLRSMINLATESSKNATAPPDLTDIRRTVDIEAARSAEEGFPSIKHLTQLERLTGPVLYPTKEACVGAFGIIGPWQVARINPQTFEIVDFEEKTHSDLLNDPSDDSADRNPLNGKAVVKADTKANGSESTKGTTDAHAGSPARVDEGLGAGLGDIMAAATASLTVGASAGTGLGENMAAAAAADTTVGDSTGNGPRRDEKDARRRYLIDKLQRATNPHEIISILNQMPSFS